MKTPSPYVQPSIAVNGFIITASSDGIVMIFRAGEKYEQLSSVDMQASIKATPSVANGVLCLRTD